MESKLPAASLALTEKVCELLLKPVYLFGLVHISNDPESNLHSKVLPVPVEVKEKDADVLIEVLLGFAVRVVSGSVVSVDVDCVDGAVVVTGAELPEGCQRVIVTEKPGKFPAFGRIT